MALNHIRKKVCFGRIEKLVLVLDESSDSAIEK